jgi:uncharacterized ubiquitin-like protein YukD
VTLDFTMYDGEHLDLHARWHPQVDLFVRLIEHPIGG